MVMQMRLGSDLMIMTVSEYKGISEGKKAKCESEKGLSDLKKAASRN